MLKSQHAKGSQTLTIIVAALLLYFLITLTEVELKNVSVSNICKNRTTCKQIDCQQQVCSL